MRHRVGAPAALSRRLSHTGVVPPPIGLSRCSPRSRRASGWSRREGDLWRWDGFTAAADAPTAAAHRRRANRLGGLNEAVEARGPPPSGAASPAMRRREAAAHAAGDERQHRDAWRDAGRGLEEARRAMARHERETAEMLSEASALDEGGRRVRHEIEESGGSLSGSPGRDGRPARHRRPCRLP